MATRNQKKKWKAAGAGYFSLNTALQVSPEGLKWAELPSSPTWIT